MQVVRLELLLLAVLATRYPREGSTCDWGNVSGKGAGATPAMELRELQYQLLCAGFGVKTSTRPLPGAPPPLRSRAASIKRTIGVDPAGHCTGTTNQTFRDDMLGCSDASGAILDAVGSHAGGHAGCGWRSEHDGGSSRKRCVKVWRRRAVCLVLEPDAPRGAQPSAPQEA